jgi:transposase
MPRPYLPEFRRRALDLVESGSVREVAGVLGIAGSCLHRCRNRDAAGKTRRRFAAEPISDLERMYQRKKTADKELREQLAATGSTLTELTGIAPFRRRPATGRGSRHHPVPDQGAFRVLVRHSPGRRLLRRPDPPPALPRRQPADQPHAAHHGRRPASQPDLGSRLFRPQGRRREDPMEAMRALRRRLSDIVHHQMIIDARTARRTREGTRGRLCNPA